MRWVEAALDHVTAARHGERRRRSSVTSVAYAPPHGGGGCSAATASLIPRRPSDSTKRPEGREATKRDGRVSSEQKTPRAPSLRVPPASEQVACTRSPKLLGQVAVPHQQAGVPPSAVLARLSGLPSCPCALRTVFCAFAEKGTCTVNRRRMGHVAESVSVLTTVTFLPFFVGREPPSTKRAAVD